MALFNLTSWQTDRSDAPAITESEFAVIDVETTGFMSSRHDRIVEVAVVHLNGKLEIVDEWVCVVNPNRDLGATHIHGITGALARDAPPFSDVADDLVHRLAGRVVVGHNAPFDTGFLQSEFERLDLPLPPLATVDTYAMTSRSLDDACTTHGVSLDGAHTALGDARATAHLFRELLRTTHNGARTLMDLGCNQAPPPLTSWPSLVYEQTEFRREAGGRSPLPTPTMSLDAGMSVCFTGDGQLLFDGQLVTRVLATELATHAGLIVKSGVSKKLNVLVAADTQSLSGKARKARDYGIPIVSHEQFWSEAGVPTTPIPDDWQDWAPRSAFAPRSPEAKAIRTTDVTPDLERNAASLDHLRELLARLTPTDLHRSLGADWTVTTALGHLTYWDVRQREALRLHLETGEPLGGRVPTALEDSDEVVNVAITALANAGDGERIRAAVIEAAEAIHALLGRTDREVLTRIADGPNAEIVQRWSHREEHVAQIEAGLGR